MVSDVLFVWFEEVRWCCCVTSDAGSDGEMGLSMGVIGVCVVFRREDRQEEGGGVAVAMF
jgi:hypothetical protein